MVPRWDLYVNLKTFLYDYLNKRYYNINSSNLISIL